MAHPALAAAHNLAPLITKYADGLSASDDSRVPWLTHSSTPGSFAYSCRPLWVVPGPAR